MSASLVGSEMCIRDRRQRALVSGKGTGARRVRARVEPRASLRALSVDPVSYTHLTLPTICSV
eukprot:676503-Alexandrium_andersonii.AAC.1